MSNWLSNNRSIWIVIVSAHVLVWSFIITNPLYAQDDSESPDETGDVIDIGEIVVQETFLETDEVIDRPTAFATVLDPAELAQRSITLPEALESVPGVSIRTFGGLGALSTISIRGMGSENVLIILDGIPLNPSGGMVDLSDIPLDSLERIEIIRGGEGAFYGGGASGGIIRLTSLDPESGDAEYSRYRLTGGSFGTLTGAYSLKTESDIFHAGFTLSRGDFSFLNNNGTWSDTSDDFSDIRENNELSSGELRWGHSWDIGRDRTIGISTEWFRAIKGIPGITTFPSPNASQTDNRYFLIGSYSDDAYENGQLDVSLSWLSQKRNFSDPFGESTGVPLFTTWAHNRIDLKSGWTGPGFSQLDVLSVGGSISREFLDSDNEVNPERDTVAIWLSDEYYHDSGLILNAAARCDLIDGEPTISPHGGMEYPLNDNTVLQTNIGLNFRPPSFEELYRNEGFVVGNPELESERTLSFDFGLVHSDDRVRAEAVYFNNQTRDLIEYFLISGFRWKPFNVGRVRSSGFELSLDWLIDNEWELEAGYTLTNAVDTSGDRERQGNQLTGQASNEFYTELTWSYDRWEVYGNWEYRGAVPVTPSGTRYLDPADSFGLGIGYDYSDTISLMLEIKNLTDENISDIRGFPLPGRSVFLTISGEW